MKILIIQDRLRIGGTERQSMLLAQGLKDRGHETVVLTFRPGGHLFQQAKILGLKIRTLQSFDTKISFWAPNLSRTITDIDPDVILCMGRTANCYSGMLQSKSPHIPVIGSVRTGKALFPLHRRSLKKVKAVIVNSTWWKNRLSQLSIAETKIHVIHNGLLLNHRDEEYAAARSVYRQAEKIAAETCIFLNVATFRSGKRQIDLLKAFSQLRKKQPGLDWQLWLAGDGRMLEKCRRWTEANDLSQQVRFLGYQEDLFPVYAAADVAVSASREDSLPNFLMEAQASGLPVIARACRGVEETFANGSSGVLLESGDPDEFISCASGFITNRDMRRDFSLAAKEFSKRTYAGNSHVERLESIFMDLIKRPNLDA